jgi:hypothetical protein
MRNYFGILSVDTRLAQLMDALEPWGAVTSRVDRDIALKQTLTILVQLGSMHGDDVAKCIMMSIEAFDFRVVGLTTSSHEESFDVDQLSGQIARYPYGCRSLTFICDVLDDVV